MTPTELREAREAIGLTPDQAAQLLEVGNRRAVYRIEAGDRAPPVRYASLLLAMVGGYKPPGWEQILNAARKGA